MKSLRRSLTDKHKDHSPQPSPPLPSGNYTLARPSPKVAPPEKVIKALASHRSTNPQELSYTVGDFLYVRGERGDWWEAANPVNNSRGLVPKSDFETFNKGGRAPNQSVDLTGARPYTPNQNHLSQQSNPRSPPITSPPGSAASAGRPKQPVYAIVQYDFQAERPDELDAKKGEPIVVIAQSNDEWFVAKPIGRLGGPGLIPIAFVEVRDPMTGKPLELAPGTIPLVEEWKKATAEYKAAAIPLGRLDIAPGQGVTNSPYAPAGSSAATSQASLPRTSTSSPYQNGHANGHAASENSRSTSVGSAAAVGAERSSLRRAKSPFYLPTRDHMLPPGNIIDMGVPSFHNENDEYWFRLRVQFVPDEPSAPAYELVLYRTYDDFYEFQISLLDAFPYEAGRHSEPGDDPNEPPQRILPYMPGPVEDNDVDDALTEYRRQELDSYVIALVNLRDAGAAFILRDELFRTFFAARPGDHLEEKQRSELEELEERLADMRVGGGSQMQQQQQNGKVYSPVDPRSQSAASRHSQRASGQDRYSPQSWGQQQQHQQQQYQHHNPSRSTSSRGASPLPPIDTHSSSRPDSSGYPLSGRQSAAAHYISGGPSTGGTSSSWGMGNGGPGSASTLPTSATTPGTGTTPGAGGAPPYIKIKIYDRATDDLIAIRVQASVTYAELFEKVRARLGPGVTMLRYRVSMDSGEGYRELRDDRELKEWMRAEGQKLVLYAEQG
ncbi:hypothetical protein IAT38_002452 [Cryptococcus sp. DSM 104549]